MPECAEVEVIARQLGALAGTTVIDAWSRPEDRWASAAQTGEWGPTTRRGKFLVTELSGGTLVIHLGMTGSLLLEAVGDHACAWWQMADGTRLTLRDPRRFGRAVFAPSGAPVLPALGPDLLDNDFFTTAPPRLAGRSRPLKSVLLDQAVIAGVGSYLADEVCWRGGLRPDATALSLAQAESLCQTLVPFVHECIAAGGASFSTYRSIQGPGRAQELFECYGRPGLPCSRCGETLVSGKVQGRSATWCPTCQG